MAWGLQHISSRELTEWQAYEDVCGPVGPQRVDYHFARLMWMWANMGREPGNMIPLADFMPFTDKSGDAESDIAMHPSVAMAEYMFAKLHEND